MAKKRLFGSKGPLIYATIVSLICVMSASISTFAWFQVNSNLSVSQTAQTKNIQTTATVYQANSHDNDDDYQTTPTPDADGTLSYDHAQGGKATNYYIREFNDSGVETNTTQMFTNVGNNDKAVIYNFQFTTAGSTCFKIYDATDSNSATAYYGWGSMVSSSPCYSDFSTHSTTSQSGTVTDNISIGALGKYYDIFFNSNSQIFIQYHGEVTTSDEMGNETGWYICGTCGSNDPKSSIHGMDGTVTTGIPMYVNAAYGTSDIAYYAGLRVSPGDVFWIMSGASLTTKYYEKATGSDSNFAHESTGITVGANGLGYYTIALNGSNQVYIHTWDGMEVNGTTRYTVKDDGKNPLNKTNPSSGPTRKNSSYSNKTTTIHSGQKFYLDCSQPNGDPWDASYIRLYFWNSPSDDAYSTAIRGNNTRASSYEFTVPGSNKDWANVLTIRGDNANITCNSRWNQSSDYGIWESSTNHATNRIKPTNYNGGIEGSYVSGSGPYNIVGTQSGTAKWGPYSDQTCIKTNIGSSVQSVTFAAGDVFKVVDVYNNPLYYGWDDRGTISTNTSGAIKEASSDNNFEVVYSGTYSITFNTSTKKVNISGGPSMKTLSFGFIDKDTGAVVAGTAATSVQVLEGSAYASLPAISGTIPTGYALHDSTKWYESNGSTSHNVNGASGTISSNTTYYAKVRSLSPCTITYYKAYDGVAEGSSYASDSTYQTTSYTTRALPSAETGYTLASSWNTSPDGSGSSYNPSTSITVPSQSTLALYACFTHKNYNYYLTGSAKGNYSSGTGSINQTATHNASSVTWNNVTFQRGETWKLYRPQQDAPFNSENSWWGYNVSGGITGATDCFEDEGTNNHNIKTIYAGTYNITLNFNGNSASINITLVTRDGDNFTLYQYDANGSNQKTITGVRSTNDTFTFSVTGDNKFLAGRYWHIVGPKGTYLWGYKTTNNDNIMGTTNYSYWFADSGSSLGAGKPNDVKNLYSMTCSITFTLSTNRINVQSISLVADQFQLKTASSTLDTQSASSNTGTVTFSNIHLATDTPWYLHVGGMVKYSFNAIADNVTMLNQAKAKATYFYVADDGSDYVGTGYGGTYTLVFDVTSHRISVTCTELDSTDFVAVRSAGSSGTTLSAQSANLSAHTKTYTGSTHLFIGESLYFKNDNNGSDSSHASCLHNYYFNGDIASYNLNGTNLVYVSGQYLYSRVDVTINYTFTFLATDSNTTKANFAITSITENTDISFKHARNAGIYIETSANSDFSNSDVKMMHTTSNAAYAAQEAPVYLSQNTYFRIFRTHSNSASGDSSTLTSDSEIRRLTESYYVTLDNQPSGFSTGDGYIKCTAEGTTRWTISLTASTNKVHIDTYTGASTQSTEHHVPYYLIGRGMPGSDIRGCDYTTEKGVQLYTYGNNVANLTAYVGSVGGAGSSSAPFGSGINLVAGDVFRFANASKLLSASQTPVNNANYEVTAQGVVTIKVSGLYRVWLTGTEGSEVINLAVVTPGGAAGRSGSIISSTQGNSITFGSSLDYSLLDAYGTTGYTFEIQLAHVSTGASGMMNYTVTNGNSYGISVAKKDVAQNTGSYGVDTPISGSNNASFSHSITQNATTYTCFRITLSAATIRSMIDAGTYSFSLTIACNFAEGSIV